MEKVKVRSKLGWVSAWASLPLDWVGLAGGTAPPGVWRGQALTWGWQEAQVPTHPGPAAAPQVLLS